VHEDGDDQARLQQHEHDDQRPAQQALDVEVVHRVRGRAEDEQQAPDLEVGAQRVLLALRVRRRLAAGGRRVREFCVVHRLSPCYQR
jgi:hypothetical protein